MVRVCTTLFILFGVIITPTTQGAENDAKAILEKAIKAHGDQHVTKGKLHSWNVEGSMTMMGMDMKYTGEYFFQLPNKFRFDLKMKFGGADVTLTAATNGKTAWEKMGPMLREMEDKKGEEFNHNVQTMKASMLVPLKEKGYMLSTLKDTPKVKGRPTVGISVTKKGVREIRLYFDKESHLLLKSATKVFDEFTNKTVLQEVYFEDYKDEKGGKQFAKLIIHRGGKPFIVEEYSGHKASKKAKPAFFDKPAE